MLLIPSSSPAGGGGSFNKRNAGIKVKTRGNKSQLSARKPARPRQGVASPNAVRARSASELVFGAPIRYQNLSIVPVGTTREGPFQRYTLLEEGLKARTLAVREMRGNSGDAQVSAVQVRNRGNEPVYLLGGEMILGGKQDRIISQDTVVSPNRRWTRVAVFCVEQGRWQGQRMAFSSGRALAHVGLQKAAMSGSQSRVWAEVARKNLRHGTQSRTSTYKRTIQNARLRARIAPYRREIKSKLPGNMKLAGLVFAINGKIRVADLFGNPLLMAKLNDKLLSSYILEALGQKVDRNAPVVSAGKARYFLNKARRAPAQPLESYGRSKNYRKKSKGLIGAETVDKATGKKVRETYFAE
jgi:hypothetical protein